MQRQFSWKYILSCLYAALLLTLFFVWPLRNMSLPHWQLLAEYWNLKPLHTIRRLIAMLGSGRPALSKYALVNLIGSFLLYLPLGALLPWLFRGMRRIYITLPVCIILVTAVELAQLLTMRGWPDVDDLLLNTVGAAVGYLIWRIAHTVGKRKTAGQTAKR